MPTTPRGEKCADPGRSDRSAIQLQRKEAGEDSPPDGRVWSAWGTRDADSAGHSGDPRGDDRDDQGPGQLLHEPLPEAGFHRL